MKFHHVGIACKDIREQIDSIAKLHEVKEQSPVVFDHEQQAELVMLTLADGTNLELIAGKQVENLIKKNISYYHICYEVKDIDAEIERLNNEGAHLLSPPKPAILFNGRKVAFMHTTYGIIELLNAS